MCHSLLFGLLLGALVAKVAFRRRHFFGGGGCATFRGHGGSQRFGHFAQGIERAKRAINVGAIMTDLELNQRQAETAQPVLTLLTEQLGPSPLRLRAALSAVAAEPFDRARAETVIADVPPEQQKQLLDGLEHLHDILIAEQREQLRLRLHVPPTSF